MKKIIITLAVSLFALSASAQLRTAYFMDGSYLRTDMNPALIPDRGYFTLPVIGGFDLGLNNNFLSVDNFIYSRDGQTVTALDSRVQLSEFTDKLPEKAKLDFNTQINLLSAGFSTRKIFWNFGANLRMNVDMTTDKTLFYAVKNIGNGNYNLSTVGVEANAYGEVYVGACMPIFDWLRVGARAKGLIGLANLNCTLSNGYFSVGQTEIAASLRGDIRSAGLMSNSDYTVGAQGEIGDMLATSPQMNNMRNGGFAVDLGAEARLLMDRLRVSIGITDLGFISWSEEAASAGTVGFDLKYRGIDLNAGELYLDKSSNVATTAPVGYTRRLNTTLNIGAEYNILNDWIAFGVLSHTEFRQLYVLSELTLSANFRIGDHFTTTLSHTLCGRNRAGIFGFALNVHTAGLNLFLGTDYIDTTYVLAGDMVAPKYQKSLNYYFGLGFNLGQNKF